MSKVIESLTGPQKRERIHNDQMVLKLPKAAKDLVKSIATQDNVSDAHIVRVALAEYFERRGYDS